MKAKKKETTGKTAGKGCRCPYCETEVSCSPICQACGKAMRRCVKCLNVISDDAKVCPSCGTAQKK